MISTILILNSIKTFVVDFLPKFIIKNYKILLIILLPFVLFFSIKSFYNYSYNKGLEYEKAIFDKYIQDEFKKSQEIKNEIKENNTKIVKEYVDKIKTIKEKEIVYINLANELPKNNYLSKDWIKLHDSVIELKQISKDDISTNEKSNITDSEALKNIIENYSICQKNYETVVGWQKWYEDSKHVIENKNKENK